MLGCMAGGGAEAYAAWQSLALQKFLLRELRIQDSVIAGHKFHYSLRAHRWAQELKIGHSSTLGDEIPLELDDDIDEEYGRGEDDDGEEEDGNDEDDTISNTKAGGVKRAVAWQRGKRIPVKQFMDGESGHDGDGDGASDHGRGDTPGTEEDIPLRPTKASPTWNWLYGAGMLTGKSYQSALCKFRLRLVSVSAH
jgi:hypothetical protein